MRVDLDLEPMDVLLARKMDRVYMTGMVIGMLLGAAGTGIACAFMRFLGV